MGETARSFPRGYGSVAQKQSNGFITHRRWSVTTLSYHLHRGISEFLPMSDQSVGWIVGRDSYGDTIPHDDSDFEAFDLTAKARSHGDSIVEKNDVVASANGFGNLSVNAN